MQKGILSIALIIMIVTVFSVQSLWAQKYKDEKLSVWKELHTGGGLNCWYDSSSLSDNGNGIFEVWIVELHNPAIRLEGISGAIYRTKTHLTINRSTKKYGILQAVFIGFNSNILETVDYKLESNSEEFKHYLPIMPNTHIEKILEIYDGKTKRN